MSDLLKNIENNLPDYANDKVFKKIINNNFNEAHIKLYIHDNINSDIIPPNLDKLICSFKINDVRYINKYFERVNASLKIGGVFIGNFISNQLNRKKIKNDYNFFVAKIYLLFHYIFHRILPKLSLTKKLYFLFTKGKNRSISKAELQGRLVSCGFEIVEIKNSQSKGFFLARKVKDPVFDKNPTYGLFITLKRVGKNGKMIKVYKLRTMHPYSEYIQKQLYENNNLKVGGKIKNDYRISVESRFLRKYWIDELPMLINLILGDIKLIGVRPLSKHFFELYPKKLQQMRIKYKPGLIPPFYADLPKSFDEIVESEIKYLNQYEKSPIITDVKYFVKALKNIIFKGKRSS